MIRTRLAAAAAGLLAAGTVMFAAAPAFATTPLTGCTASLTPPPQYKAPCLPTVATSGSTITITLPGVGQVVLTLNADGTINTTGTPPVPTGSGAFTPGTVKVSPDGTHITVTFSNTATPPEKYVIKAKVVQTNPAVAGGPPGFIVTAKAAPVKQHHKEDQEGDHDDDDGGQQGHGPAVPALMGAGGHGSWSGSGDHHHSSGGDGNSQGGGD
jgi:hypothetical protein